MGASVSFYGSYFYLFLAGFLKVSFQRLLSGRYRFFLLRESTEETSVYVKPFRVHSIFFDGFSELGGSTFFGFVNPILILFFKISNLIVLTQREETS